MELMYQEVLMEVVVVVLEQRQTTMLVLCLQKVYFRFLGPRIIIKLIILSQIVAFLIMEFGKK